MSASVLPEAIFGDLLWGNSAVRFVFVDEAGTSAHEPVTIVVGLTIHADEKILMGERAIREVLGAVPEEFKKGFIFHATEVWASEKYRKRWSMADRLALMHNMMKLARRLDAAISMGMVRRNTTPPEHAAKIGIAPEQFDHYLAFAGCIARADKYIRENAELNEVATVVAENVPEMQRFLRLATGDIRDDPTLFKPGMLAPTLAEKEAGYMTQESDMRVSRIRQAIHFVEKADDPFLQLADACAFGLQRYFSEQTFGEDFIHSILGRVPPLADYATPQSYMTWSFHPRR